jgi:polyisoprenoid-binding protein YceI
MILGVEHTAGPSRKQVAGPFVKGWGAGPIKKGTGKMKKLFLLSAALAFLAVSSVNATEYGFDKAHSHIGFTVKHILSKVPGQFADYDGSFTFDPAKPESSKVDVTIQAASINTAVEMRDNHLKSPAFFDVEKFPTITFKSKSVSKGDGDNKYNVVGDLTIHGVTKEVTLDVDYLGSDEMPMDKEGKTKAKIAAFSATTKIDRRDFGLVWNQTLASGNLMVSNDVDIALDINGMDKASLDAMKKMMGKMKKEKPAEKTETKN